MEAGGEDGRNANGPNQRRNYHKAKRKLKRQGLSPALVPSKGLGETSETYAQGHLILFLKEGPPNCIRLKVLRLGSTSGPNITVTIIIFSLLQTIRSWERKEK